MNKKQEQLFYDLEPYLSYDKIPPKKISIKFREWYIRHRKKFTNDWDVYRIVQIYFSNNRHYIPKKPPRLTKKND